MKKIILVLACALIAFSASAQRSGRFGIVGGLTTTSTDFSSITQDFKAKNFNQFHIGVCYNQPLVLGFAIQPALEYNIKGANFSDISGIKDANFKTGYLELPVQVQWGIDLLGVVRPYVFAEPFVGFALSNQVNLSSLSESGWDNLKTRFEGGLGLGAGVDVLKHIQLSFRYFWNLGEVYKIDIPEIKTQISKANCQGFKVSAAILF